MNKNLKIFNVLIILIILTISLCLILSSCNSGLTQTSNEQSNKENTGSIERSSQRVGRGDGTFSSSESSISQEGSDEAGGGSDNSGNNGSGNNIDNNNDDNSNNQETGNENSSSQANENIVTTENPTTESIDTENNQQAYEEVYEKPSVKLNIINGPEYAQDGLICYYWVKAEVTGNPAPQVDFSKDDSKGSLGGKIVQINLTQDEIYNLICDAENSEGKSSSSIILKWVAEDDVSASDETTSEGSNQQESSIDYSNPGNFRIDVNLTAQLVSIYYNENLIKSMKCSGGTAESPTVTGTFVTSQKIYSAWISKFNMGAYYWVRFYGSYLFHSVPFDKNWNMIVEEANKIGTPASHGCIRMTLEDAKWFYEKLPLGITVIIHY